MKKRAAIALLFSVLLALTSAVSVSAETPPHLWNRVLTELENQHPDVLATCDPAVWLSREPFLAPLAKMMSQSSERVACAFGNWKFERGVQFESAMSRKPISYNWIYEYADDEEAFRSLFDVGTAVFAVNTWTSNRYFRYTWQFCSLSLRDEAKCW